MRKNSGGAEEEAAVLFLEGKGIRILERNFRSYHGEIDIIALEQEMILVVEVKIEKAEVDVIAAKKKYDQATANLKELLGK